MASLDLEGKYDSTFQGDSVLREAIPASRRQRLNRVVGWIQKGILGLKKKKKVHGRISAKLLKRGALKILHQSNDKLAKITRTNFLEL